LSLFGGVRGVGLLTTMPFEIRVKMSIIAFTLLLV